MSLIHAFTHRRVFSTFSAVEAHRAEQLLAAQGIPCLVDSPSNQVFPILPLEKAQRLMDACACEIQQKVWDDRLCVRFVTSWATRAGDVDALIRLMKEL